MKFFCRCHSLVLVLILPLFATAQQTVKVMAYNLLNYEGLTADTATRNPYFRTIMDEVQPDLLICEEIVTKSGIDGFVSNVMNHAGDTYSLGDFVYGLDTNNGLIYRKDEFSFVSNVPIHTDVRDINEFTVIHTSSGDTLRIFAVHLKSSSSGSDEAQRASEVQQLRDITDALPANSNFIICGDFNIYRSGELAYQQLLLDESDNDGNVIDPLTLAGTWNNSAYAIYHTQSPRVRSFGGGVAGGLDDRFDMILFSNAMMQPGGITYVQGSTISYGNDGNHFNDSINHQPNTAVSPLIADALHYASDHLPVVAEISMDPVGMPDVKQTNACLTVYPNPFDEEIQFSFSLPAKDAIYFHLSDIYGRIMAEEIFSPSAIVHCHLPDLSAGIYFYRLEDRERKFEGKVVRQ